MIFSAAKNVFPDKMKSAVSSLNPYAAPFIPLSRQRTDNENIAPTTSEIDDATTQYKQVAEIETNDSIITHKDHKISSENPQYQLPDIASLNINSSNIEGQPDSGDSLGKDCHTHNYEDPFPHEMDDTKEKQSLIEDYEVDLAYLAAAFPSISEQSLVDVYCANDGDLEASVDMLIQLEDTSHESDIVDDTSRIQITTAHGEAGGSSHPSCSASCLELQ